jgi:hypothetical protein
MRKRLSVLLPALLALSAAPIEQAQAASVPSPAPKRAPGPAPKQAPAPAPKRAPGPAVSPAKLQKQAGLVVRCVRQRALPRNITPKQRAALFQVVRKARAGNVAEVQARWSAFIQGMASGGVPVDVNALVQWVLRESYLETNKDLQFYADKVRYYNDRKKALRKHVREIRGKLGKMGSKTSAPVPTLTLKPYRKHARGVIKSPPKLMTKSELEA